MKTKRHIPKTKSSFAELYANAKRKAEAKIQLKAEYYTGTPTLSGYSIKRVPANKAMSLLSTSTEVELNEFLTTGNIRGYYKTEKEAIAAFKEVY